ncbi:hypothetical protein BsIDN1_24620 [Bacillus safensis]|uniref:Uncharacterized protein n=1 Tax=Bacillus safensis TaxID=561879 RepID=A0A5S9M9K2_BACIA|nr:hypothetical protein BsIDN1_24620 [Bacillus safensis]
MLAVIEYELKKKKGIQGMSFSTMVLFGEKSGEPHGNPGQAALKKAILCYLTLASLSMDIAQISQEHLSIRKLLKSKRTSIKPS